MTLQINPQLFQRVCNISVGKTNITGLDVEFDIKKNVKKEPNTCHLKVWNLSTTTRMQVESATPNSATNTVPVIISAGYVGAVSTIFSGELRSANTLSEGTNQVTTLTTGDGDHAIAQTRLTVALPPGSSTAQGLRTTLSALGVGQGNLASGLALLSANPAISKMFAYGAILKGSASDLMDEFCRSAGMEWSIQDGVFQILPLNQPLPGTAIFLDSDHGMEGSPTVDTKGLLAVTCRLIPGIKPGAQIVVNGKYVSGAYRIKSCNYLGHTREKHWSCKIEATTIPVST